MMKIFTHFSFLMIFLTAQIGHSGIASNFVRVKTFLNTTTGERALQYLDETGAIVKEIIIPAVKKETLEEFKPSKARQWLQYLGKNGVGIAGRQLKQFPMQAALFFVAIGAVTTKDLVFNYNSNPAAYDQFLKGQADPISQVGFAAFLVASGLTSEPLMAMTESPTLRPFIGYLGMSVGMIASNLVSEVSHFPGLKDCALAAAGKTAERVGLGIIDVDATCDDAYKAWTDYNFSEKGNAWAPQMLAMLFSAGAAGIAEEGIKAAASAAVVKFAQMSPRVAVRLVGMELLLATMPGSWTVRGGKLAVQALGQVGQFSLFLLAQSYIEAPVTFFYQNFVDVGPKLATSRRNIETLVESKNKNGWQHETSRTITDTSKYGPIERQQFSCTKDEEPDSCYLDLDRELQIFKHQALRWRSANLQSVLQEHSNWQSYLAPLSAQYNLARKFYLEFVEDIWRTRFRYEDLSTLPRLYKTYPLRGVNPKGQDANDLRPFLYRSEDTLAAQRLTIADTIQWIDRSLSENTTWANSLTTKERVALQKVREGLSAQDPEHIGQALSFLNEILSDSVVANSTYRSTFLEFMNSLRNSLGKPDPEMVPGKGYLDYLNMIYANNNENSAFQKSHSGWLTYRTPLEQLIGQMLTGPDLEAGDKSVKKNMWGFPDEFLAPQIRVTGPLKVYPHNYSNKGQPLTIFDTGIDLNSNGKILTSNNLFSFLRDVGVRPSVMGSGAPSEVHSSIANWWEAHPEKEYIQAWIDYEAKYEDIVIHLYQGLWRHDNSVFNESSFPNSPLASLNQERSVYMNVLTEMTKNTPLKDEIKSVKKQYDSAVEQLYSLFANIKLHTQQGTDSKGRFILVSKLSGEEIKSAMDKAEALLQKLEEKLKPFLEQNSFQQNVAKVCFEGLQEGLSTLADYAQIVNSVSYVESYKKGLLTKRRCVAPAAQPNSLDWARGKFQGCE